MGCWCETCGVTQLPINAGDKVRLFVLVSEGNYRFCNNGGGGGGTCYSTDIWAPLGPAIQGSYDDYGSIENIIDNDDANYLLDLIKKDWIPFKDNYEKVPDIKDMSLSEVLHWIERDKAKLRKIHPEFTRHLGIMMVHEDVYQAMIKYDYITAHHYKPQHYKYRPYSEILAEEFKEWYSQGLETFKNSIGNELLAALKIDLLDGRFFGYGSSERYGIHHYKLKFIDLMKDQISFENEHVQKLYKTVAETIRFHRALSAARKMWHPQCGKGGQNNELDVYTLINKVTADHIKMVEDQRKEDYGEENSIDAEGYSDWMREHNLKEEQDAKEGK